MHRGTRALRVTGALGLAAAIVACNGDNANDFKPTNTTFLTGTSSVPPSLEGAWVVQSTPIAAGCGPLNVLLVSPVVLTIGPMQANVFEFNVVDGCGRPVPGGKGTVDPAGNVTLSAVTQSNLTATCAVKVTQSRLGAVESPANVFSGTDVLTLSGSDQPGLNACDASLPCTVNANFTATRCPRSGCAVTCTTS